MKLEKPPLGMEANEGPMISLDSSDDEKNRITDQGRENDKPSPDVFDSFDKLIALEVLAVAAPICKSSGDQTRTSSKRGKWNRTRLTVPLWLSRTRSIAMIRSSSLRNLAVAGESGRNTRTWETKEEYVRNHA